MNLNIDYTLKFLENTEESGALIPSSVKILVSLLGLGAIVFINSYNRYKLGFKHITIKWEEENEVV